MTAEGRERIIDTALRLFAERGNQAVSIRDIATEAEVSPALIPHHFGSKAGLVAAVDAQVSGMFDHLSGALEEPSSLAAVLAEQFPTNPHLVAYVRRSLIDGSDTGRAIFREWYAKTVELMDGLVSTGAARPTEDPTMRAALLLSNDLAWLMLHEHIGDVLDVDPLSTEGVTRWAHEAMDAYTHGIFIPPHSDTAPTTDTEEKQ